MKIDTAKFMEVTSMQRVALWMLVNGEYTISDYVKFLEKNSLLPF